MRSCLIFLCAIVLYQPCFSQKHELGVQYQYAFSTANMAAKRGKYDHAKLNFARMNSIGLAYKFSVIPKHKIFASAHFDFHSIQHHHNIYNSANIFKLALFEQISVKSIFFSLCLGLSKEFPIIAEKLILDVQTRLRYNFLSGQNQQFFSDSVFLQNQHYKYDLQVYANNNRRISFDAGFDLKFNLKRSLYLNIGLHFQRMFFSSDYNFYVGHVNQNGEAQPYSTIQEGYKDGNGEVNSILIAPKLGLSYKF